MRLIASLAVALVVGLAAAMAPVPDSAALARQLVAAESVAVVASTGSVEGEGDLVIIDHELLDALRSLGLLRVWFDESPHTVAVSQLQVEAGSTYSELRSELLEAVAVVAERRRSQARMATEVASIRNNVESIESLAAGLRQHHLSGDTVIADEDLAELRPLLFSSQPVAEPVALQGVIARIEDLRRQLAGSLARLSGDDRPAPSRDVIAIASALGAVTALNADLDDAAQRTRVASVGELAAVAKAQGLIGPLHQARATGRTLVDDLAVPVLDAYVRAGDHGDPDCSVDWALLGGIGRIESLHGTLGGASVAANGAVSPRVLGPLLDGGATERAEQIAIEQEAAEAERLAAEELAVAEARDRQMRRLYTGVVSEPATPSDSTAASDAEEGGAEEGGAEQGQEDGADESEDEPEGNGFAVIADTDGGRWDGNPDWDRAVGPMQFLPGTWSSWSADGNGDGVLDPNNLYDAARAAADYLCYLEARNDWAPPEVFVLGYNASDAYVKDVVETGSRLRSIDLGAGQ